MSGQASHPAVSTVGPILGASVITPSIAAVVQHYVAAGFQLVSMPPAWGSLPPHLAGSCRKKVWLAGGSGRPWLQLLEITAAAAVDRYCHGGWFSLEVGTKDVDRLARVLAGCHGFEILAGPAALEISDDIVAMQVIGPAGELYYFTQVKRPLPPFELPQPDHLLDELFIAVATAAERDAALAFWQSLTGTAGLSFETRIGVLNRGLGLPEAHRLPVGIAQLAGANLIEIDQIPQAATRPAMATGIAMISLAARETRHLQGTADEWLELVAEPSPQPLR